jgi:arylsulfatase A-like enzyme
LNNPSFRRCKAVVASVLAVMMLMIACLSLPAWADDRPNIIFIFADDLGYGDVGAFGAKDIKTPNIDHLAANGLKFTDFYSAANVCTPSRASLLTGRHSIRMGIDSVFSADSIDGMPPEEITIAEVLKESGYATGMVGKWHLGHLDRYMPWNQGFDEFYGVPYSNDMGNFFWYENQEINYSAIDQRYLTQRYTNKAIDYIDRHQQQPFFLYLAHSMPHVPLYASPEFEGKSQRGLYGDVVEELDWGVGEVIKALRERGLLENTLVVFSSDNGPWLMMGDHGGSSGPLYNGKMTTFDGGHRVPTVAHWPKTISAKEFSGVASMLDWFPTFSELAGAELPSDRVIDGHSLVSRLQGRESTDSGSYAYFDRTNKKVDGIREGKWKLKLARASIIPAFVDDIIRVGEYRHELLLIDMEADPGEQNNLAHRYPEKVKELQEKLMAYQAIEPEYRQRVMSAAASDKKGYGHLMTVGTVMSLLLLSLVAGLIYGVYRLIKKLFRQ